MVTIDALKKQIKQRSLSPLYLIAGTEQHIINEALQAFSSSFEEGEKDFNYSVYDYQESPIQTAVEDAETMPFIGERRIVILKNAVFLTGAKDKSKADHNLASFEAYIKEPVDYTVFVIVAPYEKLDERKKIVKLLKKEAQVIPAAPLSHDEARKWLMERTRDLSLKMEDEAAELLLARLGANLASLRSEIEKISLYTGEGTVTKETVEKLVPKTLDDDIFALVDDVVKGRNEQALRTMYDLLKQNYEPIQILALISRQFRIIFGVKELSKKGYGEKQIASALKVHPYAAKLAGRQASRFSEKSLKWMIDRFAECDYEMKTGKMDKVLILELLIVQIASLR
ncbi:DNA polymerase III subunit delta [Fictibacillus aquaticus]|uniref:DNA polymerase III subunit delta n=1 Tax=Fictibacillus aquaticus TaxID=2021314 RepID=A0A235FAJ3_9BACL|nr:DNA polymerase III subunit delta [Fictibacillus aquaticus]OYD57973.1 DNA polymerase III subunit delta [Fictibacillus aquaticus]